MCLNNELIATVQYYVLGFAAYTMFAAILRFHIIALFICCHPCQ